MPAIWANDDEGRDMNRCADCQHAIMTTDEDGETSGECGLVMPFWVPLPVADYARWVMPDDGAKCAAFRPKEQ